MLQAELTRLGLRFQTNDGSLPGCPDVVFPKARIVVFVDGDFWHGRNWKIRRARLKKGSNSGYWVSKIRYNIVRDRRQARELRDEGWLMVRAWETDVLNDPAGVAQHIRMIVQTGLTTRR